MLYSKPRGFLQCNLFHFDGFNAVDNKQKEISFFNMYVFKNNTPLQNKQKSPPSLCLHVMFL